MRSGVGRAFQGIQPIDSPLSVDIPIIPRDPYYPDIEMQTSIMSEEIMEGSQSPASTCRPLLINVSMHNRAENWVCVIAPLEKPNIGATRSCERVNR